MKLGLALVLPALLFLSSTNATAKVVKVKPEKSELSGGKADRPHERGGVLIMNAARHKLHFYLSDDNGKSWSRFSLGGNERQEYKGRNPEKPIVSWIYTGETTKRRFKRQTLVPPKRYVIWWSRNEARWVLHETQPK